MPNYQNGKIYRIVSDSTNMIYVGSTITPLCKRHHKHINDYKRYVHGKDTKYITSFDLIKLGDTQIFLLEDFPCNNKNQLEARERFYIEQYRSICVNRVIPTRTVKEYIANNKEIISAKHKKYLHDHKDAVKQQKQQHHQVRVSCECGATGRQGEMARHKKSKRHTDYQTFSEFIRLADIIV